MTQAERGFDAPRLGAIAIIIHQDRVLLVQRGNQPDAGLWGYPGGHVELGETAMAGAAREVLEETGVRAEPLEYLTNIDLVRHAPDGAVAVHYLLAAVLCDFTGGTPLAADDAKAAAWVPRAAILEGGLAMSERVAELMLLAEARLQVRRAAPRL